MSQPRQITALVTMTADPANPRRWQASARVHATTVIVGRTVAVSYPATMAMPHVGAGDGACSSVAGKRALEAGVVALLRALKEDPK